MRNIRAGLNKQEMTSGGLHCGDGAAENGAGGDRYLKSAARLLFRRHCVMRRVSRAGRKLACKTHMGALYIKEQDM